MTGKLFGVLIKVTFSNLQKMAFLPSLLKYEFDEFNNWMVTRNICSKHYFRELNFKLTEGLLNFLFRYFED